MLNPVVQMRLESLFDQVNLLLFEQVSDYEEGRKQYLKQASGKLYVCMPATTMPKSSISTD